MEPSAALELLIDEMLSYFRKKNDPDSDPELDDETFAASLCQQFLDDTVFNESLFRADEVPEKYKEKLVTLTGELWDFSADSDEDDLEEKMYEVLERFVRELVMWSRNQIYFENPPSFDE